MERSTFHQADIFKNLPEHERINLLKEARVRNLSKGEYLAHQEDIWPYVVFIKKGQLRWIMLSTSGKEHLLFNLESPEVLRIPVKVSSKSGSWYPP